MKFVLDLGRIKGELGGKLMPIFDPCKIRGGMGEMYERLNHVTVELLVIWSKVH